MDFHLKAAFMTLAAPDLAPLVQFYRQLLAQEPQEILPNTYVEFHLPGLRLGIFRPKTSQLDQFCNSGSSISLCLEVTNLEAAIDRLIVLGCPPPGEIILADHGREIYAVDPAGHRLIVYEASHLPRPR
jgi:predicted enzyme related to lactoylglutathione lyase